MRGRVTKSDEARADLLNHFRYIGRHNVAAARRFLIAAKQAMELLAWMPEIGSIWEYPHPLLSGVRVWPIRKFKNYLIFYRPIVGGIFVLRVLHGARQVDELLRE